MNAPITVAFASNDGQNIDEHFGRCESYYLYKVSADSSEFLTQKKAKQTIEDEVGRLEYKISLISDAKLVCITQIGPKASMMLKSEGITAMSVHEGMSIGAFIEKLQGMLANESKPLWLKQIVARS